MAEKRWDYTNCVFSPCRNWRYTLVRAWDALKPTVMFIGLNPSTADENKDDPTVRRCINFAHDWGYGRMIMTNIFAYRATDPRVMKEFCNPVGPQNDKWLKLCAQQAELIVAAWGNHGDYLHRGLQVSMMLAWEGHELQCLGLTKAEQPKHPLYLSSDAALIPF